MKIWVWQLLPINLFLTGGSLSNVLRDVDVTIFKPSVCDKSYSQLRDYKTLWPSGIIGKYLICAGGEHGGVDSCQVIPGLCQRGIFIKIHNRKCDSWSPETINALYTIDKISWVELCQ